jgi:hypothetical protein
MVHYGKSLPRPGKSPDTTGIFYLLLKKIPVNVSVLDSLNRTDVFDKRSSLGL